MNKKEIDSILLINLYFTSCKLENPYGKTTGLVARYLNTKINKVLIDRNITTASNISRKIPYLLVSLLFFI